MSEETAAKRTYVKPVVTLTVLDEPAVLLCTTGQRDCASDGFPGCCIPNGQVCATDC
jgi:hypothetical protein